jgi:hypothetical protein
VYFVVGSQMMTTEPRGASELEFFAVGLCLAGSLTFSLSAGRPSGFL